MRKQLFALLLLFNSSFIFAQKELPPFGEISKEDLKMKECDFDKDAEAYKLISFGDVHYDVFAGIFIIVTERRIRIKILKNKGLERANIKLRFYSKNNFETIKDIAGITYNQDSSGKIVTTKLEKSSIYQKKIDNRVSEISFTLPDVKVGSVIEYKYTDDKRSIENLDDWYFQDLIPTRISMYRVLIPSFLNFLNQVLSYQKVEKTSEIKNIPIYYHGEFVSHYCDEKFYCIRNIPAFTEEPYMGAPNDNLERVEFHLKSVGIANGITQVVMSTWPVLMKELLESDEFGVQLTKNLPHTKALDDTLKNVKDDYNKMLVIYDYVRKNMNWNGSVAVYSSAGIKSAWDKKSGNNTELNLILIDLLRDAGIKAYPLLVSTKDNGTVNPGYPFLQQFNNTMTLVIINEKKYVLNAADKYNPAYLVPSEVLENEALVVDLEKGGWIRLSDNNAKFRNAVTLSADISSNGEMKGEATVYSYGYCKNPRLKEWIEDRSSFNDYFKKDYTGIKIDSMQVEDADIDTLPLKQTVDFTLPLNSSGEYKYFTLNLFQGLEKNPFIDDKRITDIDFNYKQSYSIVGKVIIPDDYEFEELPKSVKMIMPDTSIVLKRVIQAEGQTIDFRITLDFSKSFYATSSYPLLQEFYKKLFSTLNEQIVIKKKKGNS